MLSAEIQGAPGDAACGAAGGEGRQGLCPAPGAAQWVLGGRAPHRSPLLPQPYPCAEDEECSPDEYCSSPARGGGVAGQTCLACRKRRKRCMRHAMCCPGNYCKNGESGGALWEARRPPFRAHRCSRTSLFRGHWAPPANKWVFKYAGCH